MASFSSSTSKRDPVAQPRNFDEPWRAGQWSASGTMVAAITASEVAALIAAQTVVERPPPAR